MIVKAMQLVGSCINTKPKIGECFSLLLDSFSVIALYLVNKPLSAADLSEDNAHKLSEK